jgi:hypothetical protein
VPEASGSRKQLLVLFLWLAFLGWSVWQHARLSHQPPVYDAATYFQKAHNFWAATHQSKLFNPLNVDPTFRPPGTVLMSYPFGFDVDYRGFYFRSVFFPIALLVIAVVVAAYDRGLQSAAKWYLVLVAAFLSTLSGFYQFEVSREFPTPSHWGLADNFLAGVSALAAAAAVRSIAARSLGWTAMAGVLSSFGILVKPAGILVIGLVDVVWFALAALRLISEWRLPEERSRTSQWLLIGLGIFAVLDTSVLAASFSSLYLSWQNLAFGNANTVIMQSELHVTWPALQNVLNMGLGYTLLAWLFLTALVIGRQLWRMPSGELPWNRATLSGLALASCLVFAFGIWFWIFIAGGLYTIRYLAPFALMALIFAAPVIVRTAQGMRRWEAGCLSLLMMAAVVNLSLLLMQPNPSSEWQKRTGINLSAGAEDVIAAQAQSFVDIIAREGRNAVLYSMPMNVTDAEFQAVIEYARIANQAMPVVSIRRPMDWQRPSVYRISEALGADYWLFEPIRDQVVAERILATRSIDDVDRERAIFEAWATQLTASDGVTIVSDTPAARVLRITDPARLETAIEALVRSRHWRSTFTAANPRRRWSEKDLAIALAQAPAALENIRFSDRIELRALSVSRAGNETTVRLWWKPMPALKEHDWIFFIHSIDGKGNIVLNNQIPLDLRDDVLQDAAVRFNTISFLNPPYGTSARLAVGFYRPDQSRLVADGGMRDWNGTRVIVPIP